MERPDNGLMTIEAELRVPVATVQLVHFLFTEPISGPMREDDEYRLDLCLSPRHLCFGADGRPVLHKDGLHKFTTKYDDRGNRTEHANFGVDNQPVLSINGFHKD